MGPSASVFFSRLLSTLTLWAVCWATITFAFEPGFWLLLGLLSLAALSEFFALLSAGNLPHFRKTGLFLGGLLTVGSFATAHRWGCDFSLQFEIAALALSVLWIFVRQIARSPQGPQPLAPIAYTFLGIAYVPFLASFMTQLVYLTPRTAEGMLTGQYYVLFLAVVTKFSDCGAYVTGSLVGRHPMIPQISPKKTWEGFAGALLFSMLGAWGLLHFLGDRLSLLSLKSGLALGLAFSVIAVLGDLAESVVKRSTGTKDSGHFIPGIGGAMDLIDSLLFTGPILYFFLRAGIGA
jgi:phosphatidate cytidylyltransferase